MKECLNSMPGMLRRRTTVAVSAMLLAVACDDPDPAESRVDSDGEGASSSVGSESGESADAPGFVAELEDEAAFIYDQSLVHSFELQLSEDELARLDADPMSRSYVSGTLRFDGHENAVRLRYKDGLNALVLCTEESTDERPLSIGGAKTCPKLSLEIKVDEPDAFFGVKQLQFNAMNLDQSLMRERLGYELFRQMGVVAPRAVHARVQINGGVAGLYMNVEVIDDRFTDAHFADGGGNVYANVWPTTSEHHGDASEEAWLEGLRSSGSEEGSVQPMLDFAAAVQNSDGSERAEVISKWMDVDNTMRLVAVDRTIRDDDGLFHFYCDQEHCANGNTFLYERARGVWVIPGYLNNAFVVMREPGLTLDSAVKIMDEWDDDGVACEPRFGGFGQDSPQLPPACDPLIRGLGSFGERYDDAVAQFVDGPFSDDNVNQLLMRWEAQIADAVQENHEADGQRLSTTQWQTGLVDLRERIVILREAAIDGTPPVDAEYEALAAAAAEEAAASSVDSCGDVMCQPGPTDAPLCCTVEGAGVQGDASEFTGRAPGMCGVDLGAYDSTVAGVCLQLNQPGELDPECPDDVVTSGTRYGCCTEQGLCGTMAHTHGLGCIGYQDAASCGDGSAAEAPETAAREAGQSDAGVVSSDAGTPASSASSTDAGVSSTRRRVIETSVAGAFTVACLREKNAVVHPKHSVIAGSGRWCSQEGPECMYIEPKGGCYPDGVMSPDR